MIFLDFHAANHRARAWQCSGSGCNCVNFVNWELECDKRERLHFGGRAAATCTRQSLQLSSLLKYGNFAVERGGECICVWCVYNVWKGRSFRTFCPALFKHLRIEIKQLPPPIFPTEMWQLFYDERRGFIFTFFWRECFFFSLYTDRQHSRK